MAASCATPFTLNGGLITFKASIIFFDPYPQPTLKEANPKAIPCRSSYKPYSRGL